ncbi:MAG: hypothetical protein MSA65_02640 [Mollicutes bacterium]|nr:hypothetical protein [Mollicutes bacterium]
MEEEIIYFYNVKDGKYYQSRYTHRWLNNLQQQVKKQKEVIDKIIEYLEEPNRDSFDYSKAKLLDILKEVSE